MENKLEVSILIPYKLNNGQVFVFLQKRDSNAKVLPGHFSFFGGKVENGESLKEALEREIKEELGVVLNNYNFLGTYQSFKDKSITLNVYFTKVNNNFEKEIKVNEGEYGKFFSESEMLLESMLIENDKIILKDFYKLLREKEEL